MLQMADFDVTSAQNGYEAFEHSRIAYSYQLKNIDKIVDEWETFYQKKSFDIIILDLNMPISDGYEACKKITQMYNEQSILKKSISHQKNRDQLVKDLKPLIYACSGDNITDPSINAMI